MTATRTSAPLVALLAFGACTGPNPAYRPAERGAPTGGAVMPGAGGTGGSDQPVASGGMTGGTGGAAPGMGGVMAAGGTVGAGGAGAGTGGLLPNQGTGGAGGAPVPPDAGAGGTGVVLDNALRLWWRFDESPQVTDASGHGNEGALSGQPTFRASAVPGATAGNGALELDAVDDLVTVSAGRNLPDLAGSKTIALWLAPTNSDVRGLVTAVALAGATGTGIQLGYYGNVPAVWLTGATRPFLTGRRPPGSSWHHVTYTFDATSGVHRIHVGSETPNESGDALAGGAITSVTAGGRQVGPEMLAGQIDDLRIYAKVLSAAEIAALAAGF